MVSVRSSDVIITEEKDGSVQFIGGLNHAS